MTQIELENLIKTYPRQARPAIRDISLHVQAGELLALLGPSGSGKSTILKLIAGIEQPDSGDIRLDRKSVLPVPANRRGAVLMFQKAYLFPFLSVAENIGFGLKVQRADARTIRAEVARMLELVELPGVERRVPTQLSGGEQQRVALARALVTRPRVLLLDEPLSSLDTAVRLTLQTAIRRIQRELGTTTLLVTHDLSEAITMSDRTALLLGGALVANARPADLFQRPPTPAAARFVGVTTLLDGTLRGATLETPLGPLTVAPDGAETRPATFAIRPENMCLLDRPAPNALAGVIGAASYRGEFTEYDVQINGVGVRVRSYQNDPQHAAGAHVFVQFPPQHLFEVREEAP